MFTFSTLRSENSGEDQFQQISKGGDDGDQILANHPITVTHTQNLQNGISMFVVLPTVLMCENIVRRSNFRQTSMRLTRGRHGARKKWRQHQ